MNPAALLAYFGGLTMLAAIQIGATVRDTNIWPISSFNVFSTASGDQIWALKIVVGNDRGEEQAVDPGRVLPVEFFKARSIIGQVFLGPTPDPEKAAFARRILARLAARRWHGLDEVLPPVKLRDATRFQVELWRLDPAVRDPHTGFLLKERLLAYRLPQRAGE